jgi:Uma2 family endonuclease
MSAIADAGPTPVVWTDAEFDRMVALGILPANHSREGVKFTRDQYRAMAEHGFFDGRNVCLLNGEVIEMAAMKEPHASGISLAVRAMMRVFPVGYNVRFQMPLDVNTASDPEPDVVVVPGDERTYRDSPTAPPAADAVIVIEVAHTTLDQDVTTKAELYATAGIADYWVVDVEHNRLLVFRDPQPIAAGGVAYRTCLTRYPGDTIALLAVPNVPIPVANLLP